MTIYVVTTGNWNSAPFWSSINESLAGHRLDFSALPSGYTVSTDAATGIITINDGTSSFTVGEAGVGGVDANFGGGTLLDYFTTLLGSEGDDNLDGTAGADRIDGDGGSDTITGGAGNDTIDGGDGGDSILGGDGNDVIYGGITATDTDLFLDWSAAGADEADISAGFTQDTGGVEVSFSYIDEGNGTGASVESTSTQYVGTGEPFDPNSSVELGGGGTTGDTATVRLDFNAVPGSGFEDAVSNVSFRVNDVDQGGWDDLVTIRAYDENGNLLDVTLTYQGSITTGTAPSVDGTGSWTAADADGSVLVEVAGPVSYIEIDYDQLGSSGQRIWVSDVHFTANSRVDGDDTIDGGAGDDTIFFGDGNNTVFGGTGNDTIDDGTGTQRVGNDLLDGGAGDDSIRGAAGDDTILGGTGSDTLRGQRGNDSIDGGIGGDLLVGGSGNDTIIVDQADTVRGGSGDDTFRISEADTTGTGTITITGGENGETNGDTLVLTPDVTPADITFTNTDPGVGGGLSGSFTLADGTVVQFSEIENIICFTPGTMILTEAGERPIESLRVGDRVVTRDHGVQPIRWIGRRTVPGRGRFAPVRVGAELFEGARRGLLVSPQHRLLFTGYRAQLLFGEDEVLAAASHLVDGGDVRREEMDQVTYIHLMFDQHEIIYAQGVATESFHAGDVALSAIAQAAREELFAIFPELRAFPRHHGDTARLCLKKYEARLLARLDRPCVLDQPRRALAAAA